VAVVGTSFSAQDRYNLARAAGFSPDQAPTAVAISFAECSSCDLAGVNATGDMGLMQINQIHWANYGGKEALQDPLNSFKAAYGIFKAAGNKWTPWCTYPGGCGGAGVPATGPKANAFFDSVAYISATTGDGLGGVVTAIGGAIADPGAAASAAGEAIGTVTGAVGTAAGNAGGAVQTAVGGVGSALDAIAKPAAWLGVPGHWWAMAFVGIGIALFVGGLVLYLRPEIQAGTAETMAGLKGFAGGQGVSAA